MSKYHIVRLKHEHTLQQTQHTRHVLPLAPGRRVLVQTSVEAEMWLNTAKAQSTNSPIIVQSSLTTEEDPGVGFFWMRRLLPVPKVMTV